MYGFLSLSFPTVTFPLVFTSSPVCGLLTPETKRVASAQVSSIR